MRKILVLGLMLGLGATAALPTPQTPAPFAPDAPKERCRSVPSAETASTGQHCHQGDSDMLWSKWSGVTPQDLEHEGATVDARMKAEAGEMRCVGTVHDAALRGTYSFTPDAAFVKAHGGHGIRRPDPGPAARLRHARHHNRMGQRDERRRRHRDELAQISWASKPSRSIPPTSKQWPRPAIPNCAPKS